MQDRYSVNADSGAGNATLAIPNVGSGCQQGINFGAHISAPFSSCNNFDIHRFASCRFYVRAQSFPKRLLNQLRDYASDVDFGGVEEGNAVVFRLSQDQWQLGAAED